MPLTMVRNAILVALIFVVTNLPAAAQQGISFRLAEQITLPFDSSKAAEKRFGGISAIEFINDDSILLVSDHDKDGCSYIFTMNAARKIVNAGTFYKLQGVESIRYNRSMRKFFYAFEKNKSTGIGYFEDRQPVILFEEPIPSAKTSNNHGIEGITFGSDNSLWVAYESGGSTLCETATLPFIRFRPHNGLYDANNKITYEYPFDRCSCSHGLFNGSKGNGVSEILAFNNDSNKLLVLERCFDGWKGSVRLYLATVPTTGNSLQKELVFNFNDNSKISPENKNYTPDNLEGMTWGPIENGKRTLYLVSDNNFNPIQRNQFVKLVEE